ncbi:hypothetical protein KO566_05085 [Flavobacteriaceae bacterium XHP0103]|uniref:FKBP-type peptidyl-prolyl cis-trans isomerase n=1 Tax=Marixanthotalea marina TaxID=2844359 RepID=UPI002989C040|nr:FKBP-type peptidyl-prolyl cis-trans isomerase [Marixanthotalea marina]MBU3821425.1 hypothetical protein [Marixanthotalea marina]
MKIEKSRKRKMFKVGTFSVIILSFALSFISCKKDDDEVPTTPPRDRGEQQIVDKDSLVNYLETHYYNSTHLDTIANPNTNELIITKLNNGEEVPEGHTLLIEGVGDSKKVVYRDTDYEFYVLKINQGGGVKSPTFADRVFLTYEGSLLNGSVFDKAVNPVTFELLALIPGWRKVLPDFNVAESYVDNGDGTVSYLNVGSGVMFLPSGLAYFASIQPAIPAYSPLIFKFDLMDMFETDHDGDGIPSYMEDLNGDGEMTVNFEDSKDPNDDDTDGDFEANYQDVDDDGDGVLTIYEDIDGDGDPTNDIGKNGIPKYLDPEEKESNQN